MALLQDDRELFVELCRIVLEQIREDLPQLQANANQHDMLHLREAAHRLKGSFASIAAQGACDASRTLEHIAKENRMDELVTALNRLESEIARLTPEMEAILAE